MGEPPVSMAKLNGRLDLLEALCHHGPPLNLASRSCTLNTGAARPVSATEILCRSGTDVDLQDRNGRTALHLAKDVECVRLILSYYGDPSIVTVFGKSALITEVENQRWDICHMLYDAQAA